MLKDCIASRACLGYGNGMLGRGLFLCMVVKGLDAYPRPLFWALLYLGYLLGAEVMFAAAFASWKPAVFNGLLGFSVAYVVFRGLLELRDGLPYWGLFCAGLFTLIAILP